MKEEIALYRAGKLSIDALMRLPDWGRLVASARRRWPCPPWVADEDLVQEARIAAIAAFDTHKANRSRLAELAAERTLACWPELPTFDDAELEASDNLRCKTIEAWVVAQVYYQLRELMRRASKVPHRQGAKAHYEYQLSVGMDDTYSETIERLLGGQVPDQETNAAHRQAVSRLPEDIRAAVEELFASGSIEKAACKVVGVRRGRARSKIKQAALNIAEEANL